MPAAGEMRFERMIDILTALGAPESADAGGLGVVRIAELVGREKSQVSRALRALDHSGLVERDEQTREYRLGWRLFTLAARVGDQRLLALAPPVLHGLVAALGETAHLSSRDGATVVTLLSESSPSVVRAIEWTGRAVPAHCTSAGRALLLDHEADALRALLGDGDLPAAGPDAPRDIDALAKRIAAGPHARLRRDRGRVRGRPRGRRRARPRLPRAHRRGAQRLGAGVPPRRASAGRGRPRDQGPGGRALGPPGRSRPPPKGHPHDRHPRTARTARRGPRHLRRGLPVRARAARLPAGGRLRARGRPRAPGEGDRAASRVRPRGLGRRRGVHVLRPPREAADHRQGAPARGDQPPGPRPRPRRRPRDRDDARRQRLQHERVDRRGRARRCPRDVRGAGRLGGRRRGRLHHRRDVLLDRRGAGRDRGHQGRRPARGHHVDAAQRPGHARRARPSPRRARRSRPRAPTSSA